ncbi:hypothetical protein KC19_4G085200 [Ceratodon purpureus]|uniref:F-box domain-containing protein n=1 Tax=Ceratodon purpureus TaxID=3225 RepID=A0A8T0I9U2_CERPU|nr:hypothetical protein KC19_4G085200 [Ceratodon purpureus]
MGATTPPEQGEPVSTSDSWSRLPEDVVIRVLARLSVPQMFRARTVCKQWNSLTSTPEFVNMCGNGQYCEPYFPVVISRRFYMGDLGICILGNDEQGGNDLFRVFFGYDHSTGTWQRLPPLDFLPREARVPVAAAGGIICFRGTSSLFLCNPVAKTWVELPAITYKWPPSVSVHILVDQPSGSYKVIIVGKIRHNFVSDSFRSIAIYESTTKAWRVVDAQHPSKVFLYGPTAAICGGSVYCEAICHCGQLGVMAYDIQAEAWQKVLHEIPPDERGDYQLTQVVECGGSIYMVLARGFGGIVTGVYILKLEAPSSDTPHVEHDSSEHSRTTQQPPSKVWKEVTNLCEELLEDLRNQWFGDDDADIVCVGHGTRICISAGVNLILVYDVKTGLWSKVPTCSQLFDLGVNFSAEPIHFPIELRLKSSV